MKRVFALAAVAALSATAVFAQDDWDAYVRIGAYNPFVSSIVGHCGLGEYDLEGIEDTYPELQQGVLPGNQDFITDLFLSVHVKSSFLTGGVNPAPEWSSLSISFTYDSNYIDLIFLGSGNRDVPVSSLAVGAVFSPFIDPRSPAIGTAAGQVNAKNGSLVTVTLALAHSSNSNGVYPDEEDPDYGYLRDWFQNDRNRRRLRVRVNGPAIAALPDQTYRVAPGVQDGNIIIQVGFEEDGVRYPGESSRKVRVDGCFVVPEPASMIALGSGLVGLLALRRRRSN